MRKTLLSIALIVLAVSIAIGDDMSDLRQIKGAYTDLGGRTHKVADTLGNVVLLNFWADWCMPCKAEIPKLNYLYSRFSAHGFMVLGLNIDQKDLPEIRDAVHEHRIQYPVGRAESALIQEFGVYQIPVSYLFGRDGKLVAKYVGIPDSDTVERDIEKALAVKKGKAV